MGNKNDSTNNSLNFTEERPIKLEKITNNEEIAIEIKSL